MSSSKWALSIIVNIFLIIILSTILTLGIGYVFEADFSNSIMVLEMGARLILPYILALNSLALISTIFVKENWIKKILTYFPVVFCFALIVMDINAAWTPLALFTSIFIANSIWIYQIIKTEAKTAEA